jgi:enoyl-CoA hydratase
VGVGAEPVALAEEAGGQVVVLSSAGAPGTAGRWRAALLAALEAASARRNLRAVVLTGWADRAPGGEVDGVAARLRRVLREGPWPVVGAIDGPCFGAGLEVALDCDVRLAADAATFADTGGSGEGSRLARLRLTHLLGEAAAKDIVLTGRTLSAREAYRLGLVSRVVPAASLTREARETAAMVAERAPLAVAAVKRAVGSARDLTLHEALAMEHDLFATLVETRDHKAALDAFFRKARPAFRGE